MRMRAVAISYAKSLAWIAMLMAVAVDVAATSSTLSQSSLSQVGDKNDELGVEREHRWAAAARASRSRAFGDPSFFEQLLDDR